MGSLSETGAERAPWLLPVNAGPGITRRTQPVGVTNGAAERRSPASGPVDDRALGPTDGRQTGCDIVFTVNPFETLILVLEDAGLWSDIAKEHRSALMQALLSGEDVTWTAGGGWRADGEDLAEGEVEAWVDGMAAALHDCGVELHLARITGPLDGGSAGYSVAVNGTPLHLYVKDPDELGLPTTEDPWMDCSIVPAAEVNRLLEMSGSSRRLALFWPGGNDGFSVLGEERVLRRAGERGLTSGAWDCVIP
jgi:hypothetical protein